MRHPILVQLALVTTLGLPSARAGEVVGRVEMPATCSPTISPALVSLERLDGKVEAATGGGGIKVGVVNQRGLQFQPRVQAIQLGQSVQFRNEDDETHNVHILTPGVPFNRSMSRGEPADYTPDRPGLLRIVCDVHGHMRGYVLVSPTPYFAACQPDGRFKLEGVPDGAYRLKAWHEMGTGATREGVVVKGGIIDVGRLVVEATIPVASAGSVKAWRPWSEVTDRIGVLLGEARAVLPKPGGVAKARKLAEDAYWGEFEESGMETAVRRHLGVQRVGELEGNLRGYRALIKEIGEKKAKPSALADRSRALILGLVAASRDLDKLGVTDGGKVQGGASANSAATTAESANQVDQEKALALAFEGVAGLADAGSADEAASAMTSAYFDAFEPLERALEARRPMEIQPLEARFNAIRGRVGSGLQGQELAADLASLRADVSGAIERSRAGVGFVPAFVASLATILREGVEVILLLTMLIALASKAGQPRALTAIRRGVGGAVVASIVTAVALNLLVASARGRTREQVEGWVLMLASGVLFYVSYWLISQAESRRWTDFLKEQVKRGIATGGFGTLGLTAFLAVYREGAETALMYQAMIAGQGGENAGLGGVVAGLVVGGLALAYLYRVIRSTSRRLPLRTFFKVTGLVLFGMAVVFAGNGVFELQSSGVLRATPVEWLGSGLPLLGMHPSVQALSVQGLLAAGALLAVLLLVLDRGEATAPRPSIRVEPAREPAIV